MMKQHRAYLRLSTVIVALSSRSHCMKAKPQECLYDLHSQYIFLTHRICFIVSPEKFLWLNSTSSSSAKGALKLWLLVGSISPWAGGGKAARLILILILYNIFCGPVCWIVSGVEYQFIPWLDEPCWPSTASSRSKYMHVTLLVKLEKLCALCLGQSERQIPLLNLMTHGELK